MGNDPQFILYIATTLDGYIARTDGRIDWLTSFETDGEDHGYDAFYATIDALVMGSTTYEQVLGFGEWPYGGTLSYVLTRQTRVGDRPDILFINTIEAVLDDIKTKGFKRVWVVGGGTVASAFMQRGLIDEYILTLTPIILGTGISLYQFVSEQSVPEQRLQRIGTKTYPSGMVELHYKA